MSQPHAIDARGHLAFEILYVLGYSTTRAQSMLYHLGDERIREGFKSQGIEPVKLSGKMERLVTAASGVQDVLGLCPEGCPDNPTRRELAQAFHQEAIREAEEVQAERESS